jgi:hypothetical protein
MFLYWKGKTGQQDSTLTTQQEHTGQPHKKPSITHNPNKKPEADAAKTTLQQTAEKKVPFQ